VFFFYTVIEIRGIYLVVFDIQLHILYKAREYLSLGILYTVTEIWGIYQVIYRDLPDGILHTVAGCQP
jgi:hypothetical protein